MLSNREFSRVDTLELKDLIVRKIGKRRAKNYFDQLRRFISFKISKSEFNKFCVRVVGKENVPLHNQFIKSVLTNACCAKVPPSNGIKKVKSNLNGKLADGSGGRSFQSLRDDILPPSPRKVRSSVDTDGRSHVQPSPLGASLRRAQDTGCEKMVLKLQIQQSPTELHSLGSRPPVENASVEDGEEVEQVAFSPGIQSTSPVIAPLGISMKLCGARRRFSNALLSGNRQMETCHAAGELPDTRSLRSRLEQKLEAQGIKISTNCVDLLNNSLDAYLKRLIEPCIEMARSRSGNSPQNQINRQSMPTLNGTSLGRHMQSLNASVDASRLDFHTAMALNPRVLGVDWALQFEKISSYAFEE